MSPQGKRICRKSCAVAATLTMVAAFFFYSRYLDLKKALIASLSARATTAAGQGVEIGDISLSLGELDLNGISIENPAGGAPGHLLRIKRVSVGLDLAALLKGKIHIKDIGIYYPELSIARDQNGEWNISQRLINLFSHKKKQAFSYRIDRIRIRSGAFVFSGNRNLKNEHIDALLTGLSSEKGQKTLITATTAFAGNQIDIAASGYLNDEPKRFMLTLSSRAFSLSPFHDLLKRYKVDAEKARLDFSLTAQGDTENGFRIGSDITAHRAVPFFKDDAKDVRLTADVSFNPKKAVLSVNRATLQAGIKTSISLNGEVDFRKTTRYRAEVLVKKADLSAFAFFKGIRMKGFVTSSPIHITGKTWEGPPEADGSLLLRDVSVKSPDVEAGGISGMILFSSTRGFSVRTDTTADIIKAGPFLPSRSVHLHLMLSAAKYRRGISFSSSATISSFETVMGENDKIHAGSTELKADGSIMGQTLSCKSAIKVKTLSYSGYSVPLLLGSASIDADQHQMTLHDLKIGAGGLTAGAALLRLMPGKTAGTYEIKVTGMRAAYPEEKASIDSLDFSAEFRSEKTFSGDIVFSAAQFRFRGIEAGRIAGKGGLTGKNFYIEVPGADILGGKMRLAAQGKTSLPLSISAAADNVDLGALSKAGTLIAHSPYILSGRLAHASFRGTIASPADVDGQASLSASGVSASKMDPPKTLVKDVSVDAGVTFGGKDLSFGLKLTAGSVPANVSGEVKRFFEKDRTFAVKIDFPEVKAAAIRDSFWDIFPDSLLYTGLDGSLSSRLEISGAGGALRANGELRLKDFTLTGENGEYSIGPVNGVMPVGYANPASGKQAFSLPPFDRANFENLKQFYSGTNREPGFSAITIGSISYGFPLLDDISVFIKQQDGVFTIGSFSANIFGGKLKGSAVITSSGGLGYRGGVMIEGLSLRKLCEEIEPIKGYISGKIDGVMTIKGSGAGLSGLIGKGDLWTYSSTEEKTKISRKFLRTIAGPSLKSYVGDRSFDKGVMTFYLQKGFLVFRQLEISNRNFFGMTDLAVKVAPYNNRIAIDRLLWSITEAAHRAKKQ